MANNVLNHSNDPEDFIKAAKSNGKSCSLILNFLIGLI